MAALENQQNVNQTCTGTDVWRRAYDPADHSCVSPQRYADVQLENSLAASRKNPAKDAFGPNTCETGYTWRNADDRDYVCVPLSTAADTATENTLAASRRDPAGGICGSETCLKGFVWRELFPEDHVCVLPSSRTRGAIDNRQAGDHLKYPTA